MDDTEADIAVPRSRRTRRCGHARTCSSSSDGSWPSTPRCSRSSAENIAERVVAHPKEERIMCVEVTCKQCGRPSWKGCGKHVDQVLGHVAPEDRCQCPARDADEAPTLVRTTTAGVKERSVSTPPARADGSSATPPCTPLFPSRPPSKGGPIREPPAVGRALRRGRAGVDEHAQPIPRRWGPRPSRRAGGGPRLWRGPQLDLARRTRLAVTGVDFSPVGLAKAKRFADLRGVEVTWVESAVENWTPPPDGFDLVAMLYLQLPQPAARRPSRWPRPRWPLGGTLSSSHTIWTT